ncbi:Uncharacterised protein g5687 [Pycnogonum litorale]
MANHVELRPHSVINFLNIGSLLIVATLLFSNVSAATVIEDEIDGIRTLKSDQSPFLIPKDLLVPRNSELRIDSGVVVKFSPGVKLKIKGKLMAIGTQRNKIEFTSESGGKWKGIPKDIRLVDGPSVLSGKIQLYYKSSWRSVCTNSKNWTDSDMNVACQQLGFSGGHFYRWYERSNDTKQLLYESPNCTSNRKSLFDCQWQQRQMGSGVCDDHMDLGIECRPHSDVDRQYWGGLVFDDAEHMSAHFLENTLRRQQSKSILEHVNIKFAGLDRNGEYMSAVESVGIPPRIKNVLIKWSAFNGINITLPQDGFKIIDSKIIENRGYGVFVNTSNGVVELEANTIVSDNGGDGVRYVFHDLFESAKDKFCLSSINKGHIYPIRLAQSVLRESRTTRRCFQTFETKFRPRQVMTVHFLSFLADQDSNAMIEIFDGRNDESPLLAEIMIKNNTRPASVVSTSNVISVRFTPHAYKMTYFTIEVTTGIGKSPDLNVTDCVISGNNGRGISVENERSSVIVNRTKILNNKYVAGLHVIDGAGDIYVNNSIVMGNVGDGINVTYVGGKQIFSKTSFSGNEGRGIALWFNETSEKIAFNQHTEVSYSKFSQNLDSGVLIGNYCRSDSFVNVSMNSFADSKESAIVFRSCWQTLKPDVKPTILLVSNNRFYKSAKLAVEIIPALNVHATIEHNLFTGHKNGVINIANQDIDDYLNLPTKIIIRNNDFDRNRGPFVCNIGVIDTSIVQNIVFTRNRLQNNVIKESFPNLSARNRVAAVVVVSSSNTEVYRNAIENSDSTYELGSHLQGHYAVINATYNYWGNYKEAIDIYKRIFDVKNRCNLAKVKFLRYLLIGTDLETTLVSNLIHDEKVLEFRNGQTIGGKVRGNVRLERGDYVVKSDIYVDSGSHLYLDPGVTMKFDQSVGMMVQGRLESVGSPDQPIVYSNNANSASAVSSNVRLTGGNEGKVMVRIGDKWGTVCRYGWTMMDSSLVCQQLGLVLNPNGWLLEKIDFYNDTTETSGILLSKVQCNERDVDVTQCKAETENDFENSCVEEVAIRCYEPSWSGIQFGMMAEESKLEHCTVEKAGLYDYSSNLFRPAVQSDFNRHSFRKLTLKTNYDSGFGAVYNDLFQRKEQQVIIDSEISANSLHGFVTRSQGVGIVGSTFTGNGGSGVHYHPLITVKEHKALISWIDFSDDKRTVKVSPSSSSREIFLDADSDGKFIVIRPDGARDISKQNIQFNIATDSKRILGIQIVKPINKLSSEHVLIYDFYKVDDDAIVWDLKKNLTLFPRVSTSFKILVAYRPGDLPLGSIILYVKSLHRNDFDVDFVPKILIEDSKIQECGDGISTVHYNRDISETGDLYLRNANESIEVIKTSIENNLGPALFVNTPFLDPLPSNLAEINFTLSGVTARNNKGIIVQYSRDVRNSNNIFHWKVNDSAFENNLDKGVMLNLPYVWQYNENYTHTINITDNAFRNNVNFGFSLAGHFARVEIKRNNFIQNRCFRGLIDVVGMEKDMTIEGNNITYNRGHHMVRFNIDSHSGKFGTVPATFIYNSLKRNNYYSRKHSHDDQGYYPSSYTVALLGVQNVNITWNLFSDNVLQFELLAGIRTSSLNNFINVEFNYWGTNRVESIRSKILDFDDWNNYAIANFIPFLESDGFDSSWRETSVKESDLDLSKPLGGRIYKSLTLEYRPSPYIVKADLTIMPNAVLTINPGVEMQFYPSVGILVLGTLYSIGELDNRIKLNPLRRPNYGVRVNRRSSESPLVRVCVDEKCSGRRRNGFLEVYNSTTFHWVPICDNRFTEWNARVVCHELGYDTNNVILRRDKRIDLLYNHKKLNQIRYWPEPLQCEGDEARLSECELRMNGYFDHDYRCHSDGDYVFVHCGELNLKDDEYWGGIRFSIPNFEQQQINIRHKHKFNDKDLSVIEFTDVTGAGILHGYKTAAIQTSFTTVHINNVRVSQSASHGINAIATVGNILMYNNRIHDNLGLGLNVMLLNGATHTGSDLMYIPVQNVNLPYRVFGMVDICDNNKELIVDGRILLYYKYTNNPVDCVKIFSSKQGIKPLGFRLLQFNLFDASHWSVQQDVIRLYDGDIFNNTIPLITELWALTSHQKEEDDHEADHQNGGRGSRSFIRPPHEKFYPSTEGTLSVQLHANGASGDNGFIAEIITLDNSYSIDRNLIHNVTGCTFKNNDQGAVKYANAGEGTAKVAFHLNTFENNGLQLYGNFTTAVAAVNFDIQNTPDVHFYNNALKRNQGGLLIRSYGSNWRSSLNGYISNNVFVENRNMETLHVRGRKNQASNEVINVGLNSFVLNNAPYRDTIVFSQVISNFTLNLVMNNTGQHIMDVHWYYSISSQKCRNNWFYNNKAIMPRNRGTIVASTGGQIFRHNYLVNPDNDFELISLNKSKYRRPDEKEESIHAEYNWWGYNETIAVMGRIKDNYDTPELLPVKFEPFYLHNKTVLSDAGKCGPGYDLVGKTCILYVGGILKYDEAKTFCEASDGAIPFVRGNEYKLIGYVIKKQQYYYERYLKFWIQSVDVPVGSCPVLIDGSIEKRDCDERHPFLCEKDPDILISFDDWYLDTMTVVALCVVIIALVLVAMCAAFWLCKSKRRQKEKLERRNSIRSSIHSNRGALAFNELGYKRRFEAQQQPLPPVKPTAYKIGSSFSNGSIDSIEKNPSRFDSSGEDNRSYEIYEAHNSQITFPKYDANKYINDSTPPPPIDDKFRNDPQLEEENVKMAVNPTFDYAIPNKGFLDRSYSQPSHNSSHEWSSTDSTYDGKLSLDFSQMLNGYNGYHDAATLPRNTPSAESNLSSDSKKSQPLETAM